MEIPALPFTVTDWSSVPQPSIPARPGRRSGAPSRSATCGCGWWNIRRDIWRITGAIADTCSMCWRASSTRSCATGGNSSSGPVPAIKSPTTAMPRTAPRPAPAPGSSSSTESPPAHSKRRASCSRDNRVPATFVLRPHARRQVLARKVTSVPPDTASSDDRDRHLPQEGGIRCVESHGLDDPARRRQLREPHGDHVLTLQRLAARRALGRRIEQRTSDIRRRPARRTRESCPSSPPAEARRRERPGP